ncbi:Ger(x)C family spore germination protein [Paenibacillus sp. 2TAB23]|uniref:Ger(x)C family spore germination protein n=1 Tax=Paenibacillus sp. 2TAB23 TaxID=3233004 RepID=UPI003F97A089
MNRLFHLVLVTCFLLTGCVKQQILEKVTLPTTCAYDNAPNDLIELTITTPRFQAGKPGDVSNMWYSKVGHTSRNIIKLMEMQIDRPIITGKFSVELFGKEMAAKGLSEVLDVTLREAQASRKKYLAVVDGRAKEMLQANFSSNEEKGMFLFNLLDTSVRNGLVPIQNLHEFEYSLLAKGMDPYLPFLTLEKDQIIISGVALFKDDKYVRSLNEKQMRVMKFLLKNVDHGTLEAKLDSGSYIAMVNFGSKVNYRVSKDAKSPKVTIYLTINGEILDSMGVQYPTKEQRRIKERFEKDIEKDGMDLIKIFIKEGIDPLGIGDFVRSKTRKWNEEEWKLQYQALNVGLIVKVNLTETGIRK